MKGRFLPLSPEQSLESRQGRDPAMFELLVSSRAAPSHQQVIGGGFCFYCVSDPMMILFSVHKLCPDDPFDEVSACPLVLCVSSPLLGRRRRLYRSTCFGSIEPTSQVLLSSLIYLYRDRPWLFPQVFETLMPFCSGGNWNDIFFFFQVSYKVKNWWQKLRPVDCEALSVVPWFLSSKYSSGAALRVQSQPPLSSKTSPRNDNDTLT